MADLPASAPSTTTTAATAATAEAFKRFANIDAYRKAIMRVFGTPGAALLTWAPEEIHSTDFLFGRWAWLALMDRGSHIDPQYRIMRGEVAQAQYLADVDLVKGGMLAYNPASRSGVNFNEWIELAFSLQQGVLGWLDWLRRDPMGENTLWEALLQPRAGPPLQLRVFNVCVAADLEAAAEWVQQVSLAVVKGARGEAPFPNEGAVFDVGPGGMESEEWELRQMEMFEGLPGLSFYRLPGNALMVQSSFWFPGVLTVQ